MEDLKLYIHSRIDKFAKQYEGSSSVQNLILLKGKIDYWFDSKIPHVRNFYKSNQDKTSIICSHLPFSVRLVFYKTGQIAVYVEHNNSISVKFDNSRMIGQFCVDMGFVYFIESEFGWKIGKTRDLVKRTKIFEVKLPFKFAVRCHIKTHEKTKLERYFHDYFKDKLINGEWFLITDDDIIEASKTYPDIKLKPHTQEDNIYIDKKYLAQIKEVCYE
jgi:hypothetical protein